MNDLIEIHDKKIISLGLVDEYEVKDEDIRQESERMIKEIEEDLKEFILLNRRR